jgi:hypothetical protein
MTDCDGCHACDGWQHNPSAVFLLEMLVKLVAYGVLGYVQDKMNLFDGIVVGVSMLEIALSNKGSFSSLRTLRVLRIFKLVRSWRSLHKFLTTVYITVLSLGNFLVVVLLAIFVFALLGMQVFGGQYPDGDPTLKPRANFDHIFAAMQTVLEILLGEDWNTTMYTFVSISGHNAVLYFICVLIVGNYLYVAPTARTLPLLVELSQARASLFSRVAQRTPQHCSHASPSGSHARNLHATDRLPLSATVRRPPHLLKTQPEARAGGGAWGT